MKAKASAKKYRLQLFYDHKSSLFLRRSIENIKILYKS